MRLAPSFGNAKRLYGLGTPWSSGVGFESLTEKIETDSAAGKLIFYVFAALAEFERGLLRERTQAEQVVASPKVTPVATNRS